MNRLRIILVLCLGGASLSASGVNRAPRAENPKATTPQVDATTGNNADAARDNASTPPIDFHNLTLDELVTLIAVKLGTIPAQAQDRAAITCLTEADVRSHGYTITKPGYYALASSVDVTKISPAIHIKASNVVLDLRQHTLYQSEAGDAIDGIVLDAGLENVVVKNGKISGLTGHGIIIGEGSRDIIISDLVVRGCGSNGIVCNGTAANKNSDVSLLNAEFSHNGGAGGVFDYTDRIKMDNVLFTNNTLTGAALSRGNDHDLGRSKFCNNSGSDGVKGLELQEINGSVVHDCSFSGNSSTAATAHGLVLSGVRNGIEDCVADGNTTSAAAAAVGFDIDGSLNTVSNCSATANNSSTKGVGFSLYVGTDRCLIKRCSAVSNTHIGFENEAPYGANVFVNNFSFGQGVSGNYTGAGIGCVIMGVAAQSTTRRDEEKGFDNISVV